MKRLSLAIMAILVASLVVPFGVVSAQTSRTVTVTEAQINSSFRVSNPARVTVSNTKVDLQEGQIVMSATITPRRGNQTPAQVAVTYIPKLVETGSRTRLQWDVTGISVNGKTYSGSDYNTVRDAYATALRNVTDSQLGRTFNVTSVTISGDTLTITGSR